MKYLRLDFIFSLHILLLNVPIHELLSASGFYERNEANLRAWILMMKVVAAEQTSHRQ